MKYPIVRQFNPSVNQDIKSVTKNEASNHKSKTDMYHETSNTEEIISKLEMISSGNENTCISKKNSSLDQLVLSGVLLPFAEVDTNRKEYQLSLKQTNDEKSNEEETRNYKVSVVIDSTSWGFMIGEVEILVKTPEEVEDAANKIEQIANKLEFTSAKKGGKIINYLQKHRPRAYNTYIEFLNK